MIRLPPKFPHFPRDETPAERERYARELEECEAANVEYGRELRNVATFWIALGAATILVAVIGATAIAISVVGA